MNRAPTRAERRRDLVAMGVLVAGIAVAAYGYLGLHGMATRPIVPQPGRTAVERAMRFHSIAQVGAAIIAVGILAIVWSFWSHWSARRKGESPGHADT